MTDPRETRAAHHRTAASGDGAALAQMLTRRLRLSFSLAGITAISGVAVQLVAVPMIVRTLGTAEFAVYALLTPFLLLLSRTDLGVGIGLTRVIAAKGEQSDRVVMGRAFGGALLLMVAQGSLFALAGLTAAWLVTPSALLGPGFAAYEASLRDGMMVVAVLTGLRLLFSLGPRFNAGMQLTYRNHLFDIGGSVLAIAAATTCAWLAPSVPLFIVCIFGSKTLALGLNFLTVVWRWRELWWPLRACDRALLWFMISQGLAFSVINVAAIAPREMAKVFVGRAQTVEVTGEFAIMVQLLVMSTGLIALFTTAVWPALRRAAHEGERRWIRRLYGLVVGVAIVLTGTALIALPLLGNTILALWLGGDVAFDTLAWYALAIYFGFTLVGHIHHTMIVGLGNPWRAALFYVLNLLIFVPVLLWRADEPPAVVLLTMVVAAAPVMLFGMVREALRLVFAAKAGVGGKVRQDPVN